MVLDIDDMITLREAAAQLGVSYDEVWQLLGRDVITGYRCSGQWLVSRRQIADYALAQHPTAGKQPA